MIILGIDPGSCITGYGLIKTNGLKHKYLASGCIASNHLQFNLRLLNIFNGINEIIKKYNPNYAVIEQVFVSYNPNSALKLGQARGAAIVALVYNNLQVAEYSARKVKQSITGSGKADKKQIQYMVKNLLQLNDHPQEDAADALAIAICHANSIGRTQTLVIS